VPEEVKPQAASTLKPFGKKKGNKGKEISGRSKN